MFLREQQYYDIHFYSLLLFSFFMPIYPRLATPFIVIALINWVFSGQFKKKLKRLINPLPIIFSSVYFIHLFGLFYTTNIQEGLLDIETKLTLFLFPLLLFSIPFKDYLSEKRKLLQAFVGGCIIAISCLLICGTYTYFTTGEAIFGYSRLTRFLSSHPGYQAMYTAFSFFTIIHYQFFSEKDPIFNKAVSYFLSTVLLLMVFVFASRTVVLAFIFLSMVTTFIISIRKFNIIKSLGLTGISGIILVGIMSIVPASQVRMKATSLQSENNKSANIRIDVWKSALEAIKINPILGSGTGDVQDHLMAVYKKNKIKEAIASNLNAHNQFLQTAIALGMIGLILLLLNFIIPTILGLKSGDYLLMIFLSLFVIFSLTESSLEKQQGVLFYAFLNSLLAIGLMPHQKEKGITNNKER